MGKVNLEVYLFFKGNCKEAMEFYQSVFGGELKIQTIGEAPAGTPRMDGMTDNMVMHANLNGGDIKLMASDSSRASDKAAKIELSLMGSDEAHMSELFDKLSAGGTVKMPLQIQSWGDKFGSLTDKYNIDWNMNIGTQE